MDRYFSIGFSIRTSLANWSLFAVTMQNITSHLIKLPRGLLLQFLIYLMTTYNDSGRRKGVGRVSEEESPMLIEHYHSSLLLFKLNVDINVVTCCVD